MRLDLALDNTHDQLRFQVSLLRLVYHGSLDAGPTLGNSQQDRFEDLEQGQLVSTHIAEIEQLIAR